MCQSELSEFFAELTELRSYIPHTKYAKPLRTPKYNPKYAPKSPSKTEIQRKNTKNIRKWVIFVCFWFFFSVFRLWRGIWGCISGCILGFGGVLYILYGVRMIAKLTGETTRFLSKLAQAAWPGSRGDRGFGIWVAQRKRRNCGIQQKVTGTFAGVLRGNTIRGNRTRNPERKMAL